jgi:predicted AAA+ superfamily ATPase
MVKRHYLKLLFEYLELFPCVAILGVRQCGKTSLLHELPSPWKLYDMEKINDYNQVARDPDLFFRLNPNQVAIDESQLLPELFSALRVAVDSDRGNNGRFVLTGSSSPSLLKSVSESLAGRIAVIDLSPFTHTEAFEIEQSGFYSLVMANRMVDDIANTLSARLDIRQLHDYWHRGGYPEVWLKNNQRFSNIWMQNYLQTYIHRDIVRLFPGLNLSNYQMFIQMLANLSGQIINYSEIARALGVSQPTIREYFQIADGSFIWRNIPSYEKNSAKRIVKHPKGFLRDSGLLHFLLRLNRLDDLMTHPAMGSSWESMVIENIIRGFSIAGCAFDYYYYRTGGGAEVDLVLEGEFGLLPIEVKYSNRISRSELKSLNNFIAEYKCDFGIIVSNAERPSLITEKLIEIPFAAL